MPLLRVCAFQTQKKKGTPGIEPGTSRSAVECSATDLYPHLLHTSSLKIKSSAMKYCTVD